MYEWPYFGDQNPAEIGFEQIREIANRLREATDQPMDRALDFRPVYELGRIDVVRAFLEDDTAAICDPADNDRFLIKVRPTHGPLSTRQLIAHEIGHSFAFIRQPGYQPSRYDYGIGAYVRYFKYPVYPIDELHRERISEEFARQFLVPREVVDHFNSVHEIADQFSIPVDFALQAMRKTRVIKLSTYLSEYDGEEQMCWEYAYPKSDRVFE